MEGIIAYALSKKLAAGAVSGVKKMEVDGTTLIITCNDGTVLRMEFQEPEDGVSITDVAINEVNHLICTLSDGTEVDAGELPSGSGGGELTEEITAAVTVGGIAVGKKYNVGTPVEDILSDMLAPTLNPTYVAPSASLTYSAEQYYKVGATVSSRAATVTYNAGAIMIGSTKQANRGGAATGYAIETTGADTEYSSSDAGGSFTVPALTRSTKGTITVKGTVNYAQGAQPKDSKGNNYGEPLPAGSVNSSRTLNFIQPYYYGKSASATIADFTGLTENVTPKGTKTFNFTTNNEYMVFAYDSSYGDLTSILDSNGFETISGWNKTTKIIDGFTYNIYVPKSPTTDTNAAFTFKY